MTRVPSPVNEPNLGYLPGSPERAALKAALKSMAAEKVDIPLIIGATDNQTREDLYGKFRRGEIKRLILSKVGNFAIDLPDAQMLIQVSGTFGSRQEEAQRLGRILRPKADGRTATFYAVVSRDTLDAEYSAHRQRFLAEQGYSYEIVDADSIA